MSFQLIKIFYISEILILFIIECTFINNVKTESPSSLLPSRFTLSNLITLNDSYKLQQLDLNNNNNNIDSDLLGNNNNLSLSDSSLLSYQKNYYYQTNNIINDVNTKQNINTNNENYNNMKKNKNNYECMSNRLAFYKVILHTYWTRDLFPKHYPDWRPSAQWTKTLGK